MIYILCVFLLSAILTAIAMPAIIRFSLRLKLYDENDLYRKTHKEFISRLGGLGIFFGYILTLQVFINFENLAIHAIVGSSVIIFCLGLKDDLLGGALPLEKFVAQCLAAFLIVFLGNPDMHVSNELARILSMLTYIEVIFPICAVLFATNAFNFIDGIDGLAGVLGVATNIFLGIYLFSWGDYEFAILAFTVAGSTAGFLIFNFIPGRIFMGDSGAMIIGLNTASISMRFISIGENKVESPFRSLDVIVLALLIVPIFDVLRIFTIRFFHGRPLLVGDRNHIHHRLQDLGMKDYQVVIVLVIFTFLLVVISILGQNQEKMLLVISLLLICLICNTLLSYIRGRRLNHSYRLLDVFLIDTFNRR